MSTKIYAMFFLGVLAIATVACGTVTPTPLPQPTPPPVAITVIITATPMPPTATPLLQPTLAPITTTVPVTGTQPALTPGIGIATSAATRVAQNTPKPPAATKPPVKTPVPAALPIKYTAPTLNRPIWIEDGEKDEVQFYGGAIVFDWQSVGGLAGDECYRLDVTTEPVNPGPGLGSAGDYWVICNVAESRPGYSVKFTLESPKRVGSAPNYASLVLNTSQMWANWSITVVKNLGQCDPAYQYHCKTAPISPAGKNRFLFKGS